MKWQINGRSWYVYLLIGVLILFANVYPVFMINVPVSDDVMRFAKHSMTHEYLPVNKFKRNLVGPFFNAPIYFLMGESIVAARLLVLGCMIALAVIMFHYLIKVIKVPWIIAFGTVVLPNCIEGNDKIPMFMDGSYLTWGMIFFFSSLYSAEAISKEDKFKKRIALYVIFLITFFSCSQIMTEYIFFILPAFLMMMFFRPKKLMDSIALITCIAAVIVFKVVWYLTHSTVKQNQIHDVDVTSAALRFDQIMTKFLPPFVLPDGVGLTIAVLFAVMTLASIIYLLVRNREDFSLRKIIALFGVYLSLLILSITVFVKFSRSIESRYLYLAAFGFSGLLTIFWTIFVDVIIPCKILNKKRVQNVIMVLPILILIVFAGIRKNLHHEEMYEPLVTFANSIKSNVLHRAYPPDSQFVILTDGAFFDLHVHVMGSSFMQFLSGNTSYTGVIGPEYEDHDPFVPLRNVGWKNNMTGMNISKPMFIYRYSDGKFQQIDSLVICRKRETGKEYMNISYDAEAGVISNTKIFTKKKSLEEYLKKKDRSEVAFFR